MLIVWRKKLQKKIADAEAALSDRQEQVREQEMRLSQEVKSLNDERRRVEKRDADLDKRSRELEMRQAAIERGEQMIAEQIKAMQEEQEMMSESFEKAYDVIRCVAEAYNVPRIYSAPNYSIQDKCVGIIELASRLGEKMRESCEIIRKQATVCYRHFIDYTTRHPEARSTGGWITDDHAIQGIMNVSDAASKSSVDETQLEWARTQAATMRLGTVGMMDDERKDNDIVYQ